ncbi:MAG TPA: phosphatidate cytidylyltransferase [Desulfurivibrionaceae bacterium]|nr:phosphatidate cytidylyltransferase [Desulfurivibrionaceae bacterium]
MQRLLTGIALGAGWLLLLLYGPALLFWLVVCGLGLVALHEYTAMTLKGATETALRPLLLLTTALPVLAALFGRLSVVVASLALAFCCLAFLTIRAYQRLTDPFAFLSRAAFGTLYIGFGAAHLPLLFQLQSGNRWVMLLTLTIVASDAGAYYTGSNFGRRKLCPAVSPNKTVEGLLGGLGCAVLVAMATSALLPDTNVLAAAAAGLILAAIGAIGDLVESVLKRAMGVKDSGTLLPGHGGILDRADSLLLAAPVLYYLLILGML